MGTIVLSSEGDSRESTIIDGQQRLATTALLLAAIRDQFTEAGDPTRAQALQSEYLTYLDIKQGAHSSRLTLNSADNEYFACAVAAGKPTPDPVAPSTRRLHDAYNLLRAKVQEEAKASKSNWQNRLIRWTDFLDREASTIVVVVPNTSDAFLIFETLNDRGRALTVADLLKNYLYGISDSKVEQVESAWDTTTATLDTSDNEERLLDFLRQYWSSWKGAVRERDLYRNFRAHVRSADGAAELAERLAAASPRFLALEVCDATLWPAGAIEQGEADTLHLLQLTQNRPLLLAAMEHLPSGELGRLARATVAWLVRGLVVGGIGGGTTERYFCEAAVRVRDGRAKTAEDVLEILGKVVPGDDEFQKSAATMRAPRGTLARYLLLAWDQHLAGSRRPSIVSQSSHTESLIQPVLPRNPHPVWPGFETEDVASWSRRLGNLILLARDDARHTTDHDWDSVKALAAASEFRTSRIVGQLVAWSPEIIASRQAEFAQSAPSIWPRRP